MSETNSYELNFMNKDKLLLIDSDIEKLPEQDRKRLEKKVIGTCYDRWECIFLGVNYSNLSDEDIKKIRRVTYLNLFKH